MVLQVLVYLIFINSSNAQNLNIHGEFLNYKVPLTSSSIATIYAQCFGGIGLITCTPQLPDDDIILSYDMTYYKQVGKLVGQPYCVQCCGDSPENIDKWDLKCPVDAATVISTNQYGLELKMARNQYAGDKTLISCPLKRSACKYNSNGETIFCNPAFDATYLGITHH